MVFRIRIALLRHAISAEQKDENAIFGVNVRPCRSVAWQRPAVHKGRCGFDFRIAVPEAATSSLVAVVATVYRAVGFHRVRPQNAI